MNKILQDHLHFQHTTQPAGRWNIIRSMAPVKVIVYYPKTETGKQELAKRVADVHAASVIQRLKALNCPTNQKQELLDAIIDTVKNRSRERE